MPLRFPLLALGIIFLCSAAALPEQGPVPLEKPEPVTQGQPAANTDEKASGKPDEVLPKEGEKVGTKDKNAKDKDAGATDAPVEKTEPALKIETEDGKAHAACLVELKAIGATFREIDRIDDGKGCGIDKPLVLESVLPDIKLSPEGTMRCETALELARWTKEAVLPAAKAALEAEGRLTTINQASSYICRLRNNAATGKISEHARGNAVDIASFTFKGGQTIAIEPRDEDSTLNGAFQRAVTASGCLYFATVLDPGSDEAHEDHLHFDVLERKNGYRYCR